MMSLRGLGILAAAAGIGIAMAAACPAAGQPAAGSIRLYVGTYTGQSKGIYTLKLDMESGALSGPEVAAETANPSFLAMAPTGRFLYAVNEIGNFGGKNTGAVSAFAVAPETGKLTLLAQQPSGGAAPCHVVTDGRNVVVANYGSGTVEVLPVAANGGLGAPTQMVQHQGSGPNRGRQEGPHAHGVGFDPTGKVLLAADLGIDKVVAYGYDAATGRLAADPARAAQAEAGAGPRHFAFHPGGRFLYVINELNSTVAVYAYDAAKGATAVQSVSTLPAGTGGGNAPAEIAVHPSGKFVYASNRGHNSLAIFAVDAATVKLSLVDNEPTQGAGPRHFAIDPSGTFLVAANQDSGNLVVFRIDPATGKLKGCGYKVEVPAAVCIVFAPATK
jgi:6-phosphogluconolactonase